MNLDNIKKGILIKRYKRFLADIKLHETNEIITAHCANSGSMMGLIQEGNEVLVSYNPDATNLKYKLQIINVGGVLVGVNTSLPNKIVEEALINKQIEELKDYDSIIREQKFHNSRFDFKLQNKDKTAYLEVKSITLSRNNNIAEFPDSVTTRGAKHLQDLIEVKKQGLNAYNLYLIQRQDITSFQIAKDIDIKYYEAFLRAKEYGVEFLCYSCNVYQDKILLNKPIDIKY